MTDPDSGLAGRLAAIELLVLDVDGVLTDGGIVVDDRGVESKRFHVRDGAAIALWNKLGKRTAILSGRSAKCVEVRAAELGIRPVVQGSTSKGDALRSIMDDLGVAPGQTAFIGDDLADLPALAIAGFAACPADAAREVLGSVDYVAATSGGSGVVREVVEVILRAQGSWPPMPPARTRSA